jgi:hypothetical protein
MDHSRCRRHSSFHLTHNENCDRYILLFRLIFDAAVNVDVQSLIPVCCYDVCPLSTTMDTMCFSRASYGISLIDIWILLINRFIVRFGCRTPCQQLKECLQLYHEILFVWSKLVFSLRPALVGLQNPTRLDRKIIGVIAIVVRLSVITVAVAHNQLFCLRVHMLKSVSILTYLNIGLV